MAKTIFIISGIIALLFFLLFMFFARTDSEMRMICTAKGFECLPIVTGDRVDLMFKQSVTSTINDLEIVFDTDCNIIPPPGWKESNDGFTHKDGMIYLQKFGPFAIQGCDFVQLDFTITYSDVQRKTVDGRLKVES